MNGPEKQVIYLAFCLFVVGVVVRVLPWGLPAIDEFHVGNHILVSQEEAPSHQTGSLDKLNNPDGVSYLSHSTPQDKPKKSKKGKKKKIVQLPLHINAASAEDLCALNGVGPKLAEKIVAHREAKGPFKNAADLKKVPGIGAKKLESILPGVIFD